MPARKKTLAELIRDKTFLARRHAHLLLADPLVSDPVLRSIQVRYRDETSELERRQLALQFEKAVRDPRRAGGEHNRSLAPTRTLTGSERLYAGIGPSSHELDCLADWDAFERLGRRWKWWDARHGLWWRLKHGCPHNTDLLKLHRLLNGMRTERLDIAEAALEQHRELVDELVGKREPIPDPPGLELVGSPPTHARVAVPARRMN